MIEAQTMEEINAPRSLKSYILRQLRSMIKMQDVKDIKKSLKALRDYIEGENENV